MSKLKTAAVLTSAAIGLGLMSATAFAGKITFVSWGCLLYTSPSPRDGLLSRMPSSA